MKKRYIIILLLGPIESPAGKYKASSYYLNYGGAGGGVIYIVEVEQTQTGEKKKVYSSNLTKSIA